MGVVGLDVLDAFFEREPKLLKVEKFVVSKKIVSKTANTEKDKVLRGYIKIWGVKAEKTKLDRWKHCAISHTEAYICC